MANKKDSWIPPDILIDRLHRVGELKRWTDHIRPFELTVLGKHAHMMSAFWLLGRIAEQRHGHAIDWDYGIRGSFFELLRKSVLTDMKSQVFDRISEDPVRLKKINDIALKGVSDLLYDLGDKWKDEYITYFTEGNKKSDAESKAYSLLRACSALATAWEFQLIKPSNASLSDLLETEKNCRAGLLKHATQPEFLPIAFGTAPEAKYIDLVGRLRFQLRWGDIHVSAPKYVLDHSMIVAYLAYLSVKNLESKGIKEYTYSQTSYLAFFTGLLHDLPEALTRDVVRIIKQQDAMDKLLSELEEEWLTHELKKELGEDLFGELSKLSLKPFREDDTWSPGLGAGEVIPHPGRLLKACDNFSSYMEAYLTYRSGIRTERVKEALEWGEEMSKKYSDSGVNFYPAVSKRNSEVFRDDV